MIQSRFHLLVAIALLGASMMLAGCDSTPGYVDKAPPAGGPKQSSEVPPGERGKSPASSDHSPSASH